VTVVDEKIGDRIVEALCEVWPQVGLAAAPQPVTGGQWATIWRLRLIGTPAGVPEDLVLRMAPHVEMAAKEQAVQEAMARAGVSTPRIHRTGPAGGPLQAAWTLMDVAPGAPLLADLDGVTALGRLPHILARLPRQLADTMASIHRLDPGAVNDRVRAAAPSVAFTVDELWPHLQAGAAAAARPDLADAIQRLAEDQPPQGQSVVCHGDLHPLNLLATDSQITILDWTAAIVAPPAFDVAFTRLLLRHPPLVTPPALRPVINTGAAALTRRFTRRYQRATPGADLRALGWYTALHGARVLGDHLAWVRAGDPRAAHHPWHLVAPGAATALSRATGLHITFESTAAP
jgi:aminoglycoside phosphotransferase (APT) family kinase protein